MKTAITFLFALIVSGAFSQGFLTSPDNWACPDGGLKSGGINFGYYLSAGISLSGSTDAGSQTWGIRDMNGDARPDLVIAGQKQGAYVTTFSPSSNQYWKVYLNDGSGFSASAINWSCPDGGIKVGGVNYGFSRLSIITLPGDDPGSQSWSLTDMNGDALPDLVITAEKQGANVTSYSPASNQYWKVYLNTGAGFSSSPMNWSCPNGGTLDGGIIYGYDATGKTANTGDDAGSQSWTVTDMNGDLKPDLVITAEKQGSLVTSFSPVSNQYWKVYINTGSGFSNTATVWSCPNGGRKSGGVNYGLWLTAGSADNAHDTGSQSWSMTDMNGDLKPDLVVTSEKQGANVTSFSPVSNQYWKVYLNTGAGFSASALNWTCPNGGLKTGGVVFGYWLSGSTANNGQDLGSQSWSLSDIDGDNRPDLIVTSEKQGTDVTSFSPLSNQYWKVYVNNGSGFSTAALNWSCPDGGQKNGGIVNGFWTLGGAANNSHDPGSQSWSVMDMDGDDKPDLLITSEKQGANVTSYSPASNQYWKVYLNTSPVGINELPQEDRLVVYPNPTSGAVTIRLPEGVFSNDVIMINPFGQQIAITPENEGAAVDLMIDLSEQPGGIYIIRVGSLTQKIIKN